MTDTLFSHPWALVAVVGLPVFGILAKVFGQTFQRIAKWYLYIAVFAVVVVMDSIFFPFIGGKDWFFRFAVELSLIAFLLWWAFEAKDGEVEGLVKKAFKNPLVLAVSAFTVAILLASFFAYDFQAAFWSNFERGEGAFQILHYYVFFLLLIATLREMKDWRRIFGLSLIAAGLMIGYGLLANFGTPTIIGPYAGSTPPGGWFQQLVSGRFEGSLGNPAYVAPYLIFSIFFAAYLWINKKKDSLLSGATRHWGYAILVAIFGLFFILSQTRGAFIGLGVGVVAFFIYTAFSKSKALRKTSLILLACLVVLGGLGYGVRNQSWVTKIPAGRLLQISTSDSTAQTRFWVWGEAWQGFLERPVLGWGPENFTTVYDKFFNPNFYTPGVASETWFDRAHSVFFDYLAEDGILGLLAYLSIFVVFAIEFFKSRKHVVNADLSIASRDIERGLILAVPVAYLVQGVAIFDVLPMYIPLFLFLAFSVYYFGNKTT